MLDKKHRNESEDKFRESKWRRSSRVVIASGEGVQER
jgi:hypothetical protein